MDKQFINLLDAASKRTGDLNQTWAKIIAYVVRKAYRNREAEYATAALKAAPPKLRPMVASVLRKMGLIVDKSGMHYTCGGVRDVTKQAEVFAKLDAGEVPDVLDADAVVKEKKPKELRGTAAERVAKSIKQMLARLKDTDPDAAAVLNDIWTARAPSTRDVVRMADGTFMELSKEELRAVMRVVTLARMEANRVAAQPDAERKAA